MGSDEETEQELWIYVPDRSTQNSTNSDVTTVERQVEGTLGFSGDGHDGAERREQGHGLVEDALPVDNEGSAEPTPGSDVEPDVAAARESEVHPSDEPDESVLTDPSHDDAAEEPTRAPDRQTTPRQPRQRRRRLLPTPPHDPPMLSDGRPQKNRRLPKYLEDYVTNKQATTTKPDWLMKIHWLEQQKQQGIFRGLEMEFARTVLEIMRNKT